MPVRRAKAKRRGQGPGLEKHKITLHVPQGKRLKLFGIPVKKISKFAERSFDILVKISAFLCLVPIKYGNLTTRPTTVAGKKRLVLHYFVSFIALISMIHKAVIFVNMVLNEGLTVTALMCFTVLLPYLLIPTLGSGNYLRLRETVQLMNSWAPTLDCLSSELGNKEGPFDDVFLALKVIGVTGMTFSATPLIVALTLLFPRLPCALHTVLLDLGLGKSIPVIWLQLICLPVELLLAVTCYGGVMGACVLAIGIGVLKIYYKELGKVEVRSASDRLLVQRLYVYGQIYNKTLDIVYKVVVPPGLFVAGVWIIFGMFVTIRHTELPIMIYWLFPCMVLVFTVVSAGMCQEGIVVIRSSEAILGTLRSQEEPYFQRLSSEERRHLLKRARALRLAYFSVGDFTEFNLDVPAGVWDEIMNQLVFLLTL